MVTISRRSIGSLNKSVSGATNASPIVITTTTAHGLKQGQRVVIAGVGGNTAANGAWRVGVASWSATTFSLVSSNGSGAYTSGGTVTRDYSTIAAWESGTQGNLVSADEKRIGELCVDGASDYLYLFSADLTMAGSTTDATRYRELLAPTHVYYSQFPSTALSDPQDDAYNPVDRSGIKIKKAVDGSFPFGIRVDEEFFRCTGFAVEMTGTPTTGGPYRAIDVRAQSAVVDSCFVASNSINSTLVTVESISHEGYTGSTTSSLYLRVSNCAVVGSNTAGTGPISGFRSSKQHDRLYNSVAYRCAGGSVGRGVHWNGSDAHIRNVASLESTFADFNVSGSGTFTHCISSDASANGTACFTGEFAANTFLYAPFDDFRLPAGSAGVDVGFDASAVFTTDISGATRTAPWEIGCYNGYSTPVTAAPTVIESSIGSAVGRDYATQAAWKAATDLHLVALNVIHRGVQYADSTFTPGATIELTGAVTDSRRYRELVVAPGHEYNPIDGTGVVISASSLVDVVKLTEDYARLEGVRVEQLDVAGGGTRTAVKATGRGTEVNRVLAIIPNSTVASRPCFHGTGPAQLWRNCIAIGNSNTDGADTGFLVTGLGSKVQSCNIAKIRRGASGTGFSDGGSAGVRFENCIAGSSDIGFDVSPGFQDHNASVDSTAEGTGSLTSIVPADVWVDADALDFRLKAGSVAIGVGLNLGTEYTDDFAGASRSGSWEIGAYDGYLVPPQFPCPRTSATHRMSPVWMVERRDGVSMLFAGSVEPIVHAGLLFEPTGGIEASARRAEASLREHNFEARGIISSDKITFADLAAGKYRGARITEYLVDWKYPFTQPITKAVYYLRETEFDGDTYTAQPAGISSLLQRTRGGSYGPRCPYKLGGPLVDARGRHGCGVDMSQHTELDIEVAAVGDPLLEFDAKDTGANSIPVTHPDDDFVFGELRWKSGDNQGTTSEVRVYTSATRTIALFKETEYPIQVGDRFDIEEGCDREFTSGCAKFGNKVNFGGEPYSVGSDQALETPTS